MLKETELKKGSPCMYSVSAEVNCTRKFHQFSKADADRTLISKY